MNHDQIRAVMRAIEQDASLPTNEHIKKAISLWYAQQEQANNAFKDAFANLDRAQEVIERHKALLDSIKGKERLERKIFQLSSNAALLTTVGAAISATVLPVVTIPAVVAASIAALGGYISKLKIDSDAMDEVKKMLAQEVSEHGKEETDPVNNSV